MPRQTKKFQATATKGIIWARVSSREQEDGYSLDAQIENSKSYAARKGIDIIKIFEIIESSTQGDRKQFHDMINWVKRQNSASPLFPIKLTDCNGGFQKFLYWKNYEKPEKSNCIFHEKIKS